MDSIDFWSARVRDLEQRITIARQAALEHAPTTSYFVFFNNQKDAAIAAQTNLHAEDGHSFRVMEAPGPEEVGFACLVSVSLSCTLSLPTLCLPRQDPNPKEMKAPSTEHVGCTAPPLSFALPGRSTVVPNARVSVPDRQWL